MLGYRFGTLTKRIMTKQVKMLNNLYGAVCDNQYLLTAMPAMAKRAPTSRNLSDEVNEWQKETELLKNFGKGDDDICERCRSPMHLPPAKAPANKKRDSKKAPNRPRGTGTPIRQPDKQVPDILDTWRDPLTTKIQLANPPEEDGEGFMGHNISMI